MNVFVYAMFKAAREKMTPEEIDRAMRLANLADDGVKGSEIALRRMVYEVLFRPVETA